MALRSGDRVGPYEIVSPLGAGGMGEVYRARDPRLGRDLALKVLPSESSPPDRFHRFEQEARAIAALDHPHILAIHDVGTDHGMTFLALERLDGETLRQRLEREPLSPRRTMDYAVQLCQGLAAAHAAGVIHRDLKPENLFLTRDGQLKILDFGLARLLREPEEDGAGCAETVTVTQPGTVLGTAGYMSPEQVRGAPSDARSDIFALGVVLFEMLSGRSPFRKPTRAETLAAILREDPPELVSPAGPLPPALDRIARRCLEKDPEDRFQSARDVAFALEALSSATGGIPEAQLPGPRRFRWPRSALLVLFAAGAGGAAGLWFGKHTATRPPATFKFLTTERGVVYDARFTPDGQTVVYSAAWDGRPPEVFSTRVESPVPRPFGFPPGGVQSVSASGELLLLRSRPGNVGWPKLGTLARVPFAGGVPRDLLEDVAAADWAPDGSFCVLRRVGPEMRIEWPVGTLLYRSPLIYRPNFIRVSPRGDLAAFEEDTPSGPAVRVVARDGRVQTIASGGQQVMGYAWSPGGAELWYIKDRVLRAVDTSGHERSVHSLGAYAFLFDISAEGRALLSYWRSDSRVRVRSPGDPTERDLLAERLSLRSLSPDGLFLLGQVARLGQPLLAPLRGGDPVNLGALGHPGGSAVDLSIGGARVLFREPGPPARLVDAPTGAGEARAIPLGTVEPATARWLADGESLLILGHEPGGPNRLFVKRLSDTTPRPLTPETPFAGFFAASPDGAWVAVHDGQSVRRYPVPEGDPREVPGYQGHDELLGWSDDGETLYLRRDPDALAAPARLFRLDVRNGRQTPWMDLAPPDRVGLMRVGEVFLARGGQAYAYRYNRTLHDLCIADGLK